MPIIEVPHTLSGMFQNLLVILCSVSKLCFLCYVLEVQDLAVAVLFFKFIALSWMLLCTISQTAYFTASYNGSLERMLAGTKLRQECAKHCRRTATIYVSLAWILLLSNLAFLMYAILFSGGYMDITLAPIAIHVDVPNIVVPRIVLFVVEIYLCAAWIMTHAMSLMLANVFSHQYGQVERTLERHLSACDKRRVPEQEIEILRQRHQEISLSVDKADRFLMFANAGAFCCQLFGIILILYTLIFYQSLMTDPVITIMRAFWIFVQSFGLSVTAAGGIMVNHYVS